MGRIYRSYSPLALNTNKCDQLRENPPFAKIFQNALVAPKVTLAKKLIPNLNHFWSRNGISVL